MTKNEKRLWVGIGGVIILILLLLARRANASSVTNNYAGNAIDIPSQTLPIRSPITIDLPQIPGMPAFDFSMVSACMCGGSNIVEYAPAQGIDYTYNLSNYSVTNIVGGGGYSEGGGLSSSSATKSGMW